MMINCKIKYKDEMIEVFLKETSIQYLIDHCCCWLFNAPTLTYVFNVNYNLWRFIIELLNKDGFRLTSKYFNDKGENIT